MGSCGGGIVMVISRLANHSPKRVAADDMAKVDWLDWQINVRPAHFFFHRYPSLPSASLLYIFSSCSFPYHQFSILSCFLPYILSISIFI